jgi:membrane protease subunit (stomatin/prohibitin family)
MICSAAATISYVVIFNSNLSILDKVVSRLAASMVAAASAEVFASAVASVLAVGTILDTEAEGGVFSIDCITLPILHFFSPYAFFVAEGSCFF